MRFSSVKYTHTHTHIDYANTLRSMERAHPTWNNFIFRLRDFAVLCARLRLASSRGSIPFVCGNYDFLLHTHSKCTRCQSTHRKHDSRFVFVQTIIRIWRVGAVHPHGRAYLRSAHLWPPFRFLSHPDGFSVGAGCARTAPMCEIYKSAVRAPRCSRSDAGMSGRVRACEPHR